MARNVKCKASGEWGTSDDFVKIDGSYYKSFEVYEKFIKDKRAKAESVKKRKQQEAENKEFYKKIIALIAIDLMDYNPGQPFPKIISRKLKDLEFYDRKIIYLTIKEIKDDLRFAMSRIEFKNDTGKASYIFAAISNHINDVYQREKKKEKVESASIKGSETLLEMSGLFNMNENLAPTKQKSKDISKFLDEE